MDRKQLIKDIKSRKERLAPDTEREIMALFEHEHRGVSAVVTSISHYHREDTPVVIIEGKMRFEGHVAGDFLREIRYNKSSNQLVMEHSRLYLKPAARGHGAGRAWVRTCLRRYRRITIDKVETSCGWMDGGYVWARLGFQLKHPREAHDIWESSKHALCALQRRGLIREQDYDRWGMRFESGQINTVDQILRLGRERSWRDKKGRLCWAGKTLLHGAKWEGRLQLSDASGR